MSGGCQLALISVLLAACAGSPTEATTLAHETSGSATTSDATTDEPSTTDDPSTTATTTDDPSMTDPSTTDPTTTDPATTDDPATSSSSAEQGSSSTGEPAECHPLIVEVFNDPQGTDDMLEWVELTNPCHHPIDLAGYSLAWGGEAYGPSLDLVGEIEASGCFVVGGPMSGPLNFDPMFDQSSDFATDLENTTNAAADAIALFAVPAAEIGQDTVPVDALIYGESNENELIDETGAAGDVDVPAGEQGEGYARVDEALLPESAMWTITSTPSPGVCPNP